MNRTVKIVIALILTLTLAAGGFFLGLQFTEKIPLEAPIKTNFITLHVDGARAEDCVDMILNGIVSNRLVENLMLLCTPDDLLMSMRVEKVDTNTLLVEIPMEDEGNMIYFADELAWILQEECQKTTEDVSVTIAAQKKLTVTYEEQPDVTMAYVLTAFGAVLGILFSLLMVLFDRKKRS